MHLASPQDVGASAVLMALGAGVRTLELSTNDLTEAVAEDVGAFIGKNALSLEYLGLEGNAFGPTGAFRVRSPASRFLSNEPPGGGGA